MAYILQLVSGNDVKEVEFPSMPVFADVNTAIRSFSMDVAKYADEDGDLCTLTECTFDDFLSVAQHQEAERTLLRIQLLASALEEPFACDESLSSPSTSQCSSTFAGWTLVGQDNAEDPGDSNVESSLSLDMQKDDAMSQESQSIVVQPSSEPKCDDGQVLIPVDDRNPSNATSDWLDVSQVESAHDAGPRVTDSLPGQLLLKLGVCATEPKDDDESVVQPDSEEELCPDPDIRGTVSVSDVGLVDLEKTTKPLREDIGQAAEQLVMDQDGSGVHAQSDDGLTLQLCSCKVCSHALTLYTQVPFVNWACDICDRSFVQSDPMWACPTGTTWGICTDCHANVQDGSIAQQANASTKTTGLGGSISMGQLFLNLVNSRTAPEAAETGEVGGPAATKPLETEMLTPASVSNDELLGVQELPGPSDMASEQNAECFDAQTLSRESPAQDTGTIVTDNLSGRSVQKLGMYAVEPKQDDESVAQGHSEGEKRPEPAVLGTASTSDGGMPDLDKNTESSSEAIGQAAERLVMDQDCAEGQSQSQDGLTLQQCSCRVCSHALALCTHVPFVTWACDICDRSFVQSDPMWACPTARACDWGICTDCHTKFQDDSIVQRADASARIMGLNGLMGQFLLPRTAPETAETGEVGGPAATKPLETEMLTPASVSNDDPLGVQELPGPSSVVSQQSSECFGADTRGVETPAAPEDDGLAPEHQPCPCKVCCKSMDLHLPAPFKNWLCDFCDRSFAEPDPMWACATAKACNWGICVDCHEHLQDKKVAEDYAQTCQPCEQHTSSNSVLPLLAGAVGAALLGAPLLGVPLFLAAKKQYRRSCRRS